MSALSEQLAKAETLRKAASLMRKRAKAAWPSPWLHMGILGTDYNDLVEAPGVAGRVAETDDNTENAAHIASWHPDVALAVADWLDSVALSVDKRDNPEHVGGQHKGLRIPDEYAALNVARTYLGGAA